MERRFCPFVRGKCRGEACMLWVQAEVRDHATNEPRLEAGCVLVFQLNAAVATYQEMGRVQASSDKVATEVAGAGDKVIQAATRTAIAVAALAAGRPAPVVLELGGG